MPPDDPNTTHEWRVRTSRAAPLIDGVDYYRALRSALIRARHHVIILGWEIHSEVDLLRGDDAENPDHPDHPVRFADLLLTLVEQHPELRIDLLIWEGASLFALERQHVPRMKRPWNSHPRLRLVWDRTAPRLGSHHQKLVTIDDRIAFVGGMDITKSRWDTHRHNPNDPRRRKPGLIPSYANPYHDAMLAIDDEAARTLADWARERWRRATGETLQPPDTPTDHDPWPRALATSLTDIRCEIARTQPDFDNRTERRQVEHAFLAQIQSAEHLIYIETQYLASDTITDALCARLREDDPPEIIIILPPGCPGRLQSLTMDAKRDQLLERLRDADHADRFRAWWPTLAAGDTDDVFERSVYVHAKVTIIDDRLLRIGSANLNNRSMGLDTELDATLHAEHDEDEHAIAALRRQLIGWFLGVEPQTLQDDERAHDGRVIPAIDAHTGAERSLHPFEHRAPATPPAPDLSFRLADPDRPLDDLDADRALRALARHTRLRARLRLAWNTIVGTLRRWQGPIIFSLAILTLVLVVRLTPLHTLLDRQRIESLFTALADHPAGLPAVALAFVLLASFGAPVTLLITVVGALFPAPQALVLNLSCVLASACPAFALGRLFPATIKQRTESDRLERVREHLERNTLLGVAILRNIPVAPFAVANAALGVVRVRWIPYLAGTLMGMAPGVVLITLLGDRITGIISDPSPTNILALLGIALVMVTLALGAQRWFNTQRKSDH
ncbi:MAG: VTT domain-containing protein [Phycisphaerales bacterium]